MFSSSPSADPRLRRYDHLIVHVTATRPDQDFDDTDIDRMHRARGFSGCGYNALIKRDGTWLDSDMGKLTRGIGKQGAHVGNCGPGWNGRCFGVSLVGGVDADNRPEFNMTDAQMETLRTGINRFLELHPLGAAHVTIMGHRDLIAQTEATLKKACPCFDVVSWWNERIEDVDAEPDDDAAPAPEPSPIDLAPTWTVVSGDTLSRISGATGISIAAMRALNPEITDANLIRIGQIIRLA